METVYIVAIAVVAAVVLVIALAYRGRLTSFGIRIGKWSGTLQAEPDRKPDAREGTAIDRSRLRRFRFKAQRPADLQIRKSEVEDTTIVHGDAPSAPDAPPGGET